MSKKASKKFDPKKLRKGDSVIYKNVGYGLTSYERGDGDVIGVKGDKLFTDTFDRIGMAWDARLGTWCFDGGLGLKTYIVDPSDPVAAKEAA